ncbi:2-oxo-4-hydroxy-4-carboxy-5-ureidoimidazoline decarboxylase [Marinactinospora thermotolerans]|uniref:2-oxo-4-hydroxy-4-carboxy-5-ureidoimidazoline decarboxylase n=1 Tax=Marinactinospora thermotolerans DSM 45154 TaxID=1122192 RepID=A0A1T4LNN8_9ACTN|nr:2-oxo-4-hydroxy-4-carboxy-5-ureidoimidazoline decarboxylase [Marinactinospora thermotolerans]SJZ56315.1 2-oxo-4-hydroxy-4-carboxy-5-ureidoimidazoline decarboxylase [Marinactinospora thermotolerans DSM 45154]
MPESTDTGVDSGLSRVNALSAEEFQTEFARCLDIDRWVTALERERPFNDRTALFAAADAHARTITDDEVAKALARHPRIGERATGRDTESAWSRGEQAGVDTGRSDVRDAFQAANAEYERRFGQIYLVCASGRSGEELLADLTDRLGNDPATEARVVADELRKIALVRVEKVLDQ